MAGYIDHTLLKPEATGDDITRLCHEAMENNFYAVCVNPSFVELSAATLKGSGVKVAAVVGFPLGATTTAVKAFETAEAIENGAAEVDMVIHVGALKSGDSKYVLNDIQAVVNAAKGKPVKVIIETGLLNEDEKVLACRLAAEAGAAYVKTSTGFGPGGATIADVQLMRETVGSELGVKASGGVRTSGTVHEMIEAGATRIGTSSGLVIVKT